MASSTTNYGRDTSCLDGLRTGRLVSGARLVAEAAYRRLITPHGILRGGPDEENYGFDLADKIGSVASDSEAAALPGQIAAEFEKDERIESVDVDVKSTKNGPSTTWTVTITAMTSEGPFTLVLAINDVTIELLNVTPGV